MDRLCGSGHGSRSEGQRVAAGEGGGGCEVGWIGCVEAGMVVDQRGSG